MAGKVLNTTNFPAATLAHVVGLTSGEEVATQPVSSIVNSTVEKLKKVALGATFPGTMASPPTIAAASKTSAVTGSVVAAVSATLPNTAIYRFLTGNPVQAGPFYPKESFVSIDTQTDGLFSEVTGTTAGAEFVTDAPEFELQFYGAGSDHRILVDGEFASTTFVSIPSDGDIWYQKLTFSTRAPRLIRVVGTGGMTFGGVKITALDSVWKSSPPVPLRMICMGDSFTEGIGATNTATSLVPYIGGYLGIEDIWASALGGTGYLQTNSGRVKFRDRLASDVIAYSPDIVLTMGGINDNSADAAALQTEVAAYHAALRAGLPDVLNFVLGPWNPKGNVVAPVIAAVSAGATAGDPQCYLIDNNTVPWQSQTAGNTSSPAGLGNGDVYLSSDDTHPSQAGHQYLARRVADEIKRIIAAL